jgi:hypothetical protein
MVFSVLYRHLVNVTDGRALSRTVCAINSLFCDLCAGFKIVSLQVQNDNFQNVFQLKTVVKTTRKLCNLLKLSTDFAFSIACSHISSVLRAWTSSVMPFLITSCDRKVISFSSMNWHPVSQQGHFSAFAAGISAQTVEQSRVALWSGRTLAFARTPACPAEQVLA